ncbi:MAG: hypothetical protein RIC35_03420 [Marinoscillum sp.]
MEFRIIMGDSWKYLGMLTEQVFCDCINQEKRLVDYTPYLTKLNDILLKGFCSGCGRIAARHIETGESPEKSQEAERIRKEFAKSKTKK